MKRNLHLRVFAWALVPIVLDVFQATAVTQVSPGSSANAQTMEAPKRSGTTPASTEPILFSCPSPGISTLQSSTLTGHHTVTLSWDASASSINSGGKTVNYCLYRSLRKSEAEQYATALSIDKKNAECKDCEQINPIAIPGTRCVDTLVEDGKTYYYAATAIDAQGRTSLSSNEARADIPLNKTNPAPAQSPPMPSCRERPAPR